MVGSRHDTSLDRLFLHPRLHRHGHRNPDYKVLSQDGKFEVREYPALTLVRTTSGDGDFMRLFRYISGGNEAEQKIAMTAPVLMKHEGEDTGMSFIVP
ncbi:MAG: SOUL family heme-binding protein, partial [Chthoniobacterales bacterium]